MSYKFVPPKEDIKTFPRYASYAAGTMKTHSTMSGAKQSWNNRGWEWSKTGEPHKRVTKHGFILENVEGEWFVRYEINPGLTFNELPWREKMYKHKVYGWTWDQLGFYHKPEDFSEFYRNHQVTTDEYVTWRLAVEYERLGISK